MSLKETLEPKVHSQYYGRSSHTGDFPDQATFKEKGVSAGVVIQTWGHNLMVCLSDYQLSYLC